MEKNGEKWRKKREKEGKINEKGGGGRGRKEKGGKGRKRIEKEMKREEKEGEGKG